MATIRRRSTYAGPLLPFFNSPRLAEPKPRGRGKPSKYQGATFGALLREIIEIKTSPRLSERGIARIIAGKRHGQGVAASRQLLRDVAVAMKWFEGIGATLVDHANLADRRYLRELGIGCVARDMRQCDRK